jgi:hypothetical protein
MPRVEIVPSNHQCLPPAPTVDVCRGCSKHFVEGGEVPDEALEELFNDNHKLGDSPHVGSIDVEHPSYADADYECVVCGLALTEEDN